MTRDIVLRAPNAPALRVKDRARTSGAAGSGGYRLVSADDLLIRVYVDEMSEMVDAVEARLRRRRKPREVANVADILAKEQLSRPLLYALAGTVWPLLLREPYAESTGTRKTLPAVRSQAAVAIRSALPWLSRVDATRAVEIFELQLASPERRIAHPSSAATGILSRSELSSMRLQAQRDFARFVEVYLEGLRSIRERGASRRRPQASCSRRQSRRMGRALGGSYSAVPNELG